jgi:hypothetical protein
MAAASGPLPDFLDLPHPHQEPPSRLRVRLAPQSKCLAQRQASFAEFEMLMGFDDEALKRYGLPKPMVEQALLEVYQTVVLDQ